MHATDAVPPADLLDRRRALGRLSACAVAPAVGALVSPGCAAPEVRAPARPPPVWPAPPEQPRYIYETTLRNAASLRRQDSEERWRRALTGTGAAETAPSIGKPFAVAARQGFIYVSDTEGRRVFVFDVPRRRTFAFGTRLEGELRKPAGLALDGIGRVYVVDASAHRLVIYDPLGLYLDTIDGRGAWVRPSAVAVTPAGDALWVVDTGGVDSDRHVLWRYVRRGDAWQSLGAFGRRGSAPGEFNLPLDAAVGRDGALWVLDAGNFRVQAFDADGRARRSFGSAGNGLGQFARPRGLAIDREGHVCVCDTTFCNVQVFRDDGTLMLALGTRHVVGRADAPGHYALPGKIACDETGRLYVVDQYLHKVEVLRHLSDEEGRRRLAAT